MFLTPTHIKMHIISQKRTQLEGGPDILQHNQAPKVSISVYQQIRVKRKNLQSFQLAEHGLCYFYFVNCTFYTTNPATAGLIFCVTFCIKSMKQQVHKAG